MFYEITLLEEKKWDLEYEFSKVITLCVIVRQVVFTISTLIFGNFNIYTDLLVLASVIPCYIIIISIPKYNFQKIGLLGNYYFLFMSIFFGAMYYYGFSFIVIVNAIFPVSFLFFYSFKKTILFSLLIFLHFPIVYLFYDYNVIVSANFLVQKEIYQFLHFFFFVFFLLIVVYYLIQVVKIKAIIHFLQYGNVNIDSFFWGFRSKEEFIYLKQKKDNEDNDSSSYYSVLFTKIETHMRVDIPWKNASFSLGELAKSVNSNSMYVSVAINKMSDSNFKVYVNEFRLKAIVNEIKQKKNNNEIIILKDIYLNNGFNHQATFNKVFKTHFGKTPQEYINSVKKEIVL